MKKRLRVLPILAASTTFAATIPAFATDGVIEINQDKVVASGGFPYAITAPGSYRLTSNLDVRNSANPADRSAIVVSGVNFVSIDLNGFGIIGPASCDPSCVNTGEGDGITVVNLGEFSVSNGFVTGMGDKGITGSPGFGRVERVTVYNNGGNGIEFANGIVKDSIVRTNGGHGIAGGNLVISGNTVYGNLGRGIWAFGPAAVVNCSVQAAPNVPGVKLTQGSLHNSSVAANGASALECESSCTLGGNTFLGCANLATCISGATPLQIPAGSNVCGTGLCL